MATDLRTAASRFYGMPVTHEILGPQENEYRIFQGKDLVRAHISNNYRYFGLIDKTLSGFVILDDEGDNYYLLDLRDTGQVYWQDHETREISLQFANLADYRDQSGAWDPWEKARRENRKKSTKKKSTKKKSTKAVPTEELAGRYQWLVWFYAQPMKEQEHFKRFVCKTGGRPRYEDMVFARYAKERSALATDTHLALYWLLCWAAYTDMEKVEDVIAAAGPRQPELFTAFAQRFSGLRPTDTLEDILPTFRQRRALFMFGRAIAERRKDISKILLSFEMDPEFLGFEKLFHIDNPGEEQAFSMDPEFLGTFPQRLYRIAHGGGPGEEQVKELEQVVERITGAGATCAFAKALIDKWRGKKESEAAGQFARLCLEGSITREHLDAFSMVGALIADSQAIIAASGVLLKQDPYCCEILKLRSQALRKTGENDQAARIESLCKRLDEIEPIYAAYVNGSEKIHEVGNQVRSLPESIQELLYEAWGKEKTDDRAAIDKLAPELRSEILALSEKRLQGIKEAGKAMEEAEDLPEERKRLFAERILYAWKYPDGAVEKSLIWILQLGSPQRAELLGRGFKLYGSFLLEDVLKAMRAAVPHPDGALATDLLKAPSFSSPKKSEEAEDQAEIFEGILEWVNETAAAPALWDGLLDQLETPGRPSTKEAIINSAFGGYAEKSYIHKLSDEQAKRLARILIKLNHQGTNEGLFYAAGQALSDFDHKGAKDVLVEALNHEHEEELVENLGYAVRNVRKMKTKRSRKR